MTLHLRRHPKDERAMCGVKARTTRGRAKVCAKCLRAWSSSKAPLPAEARPTEEGSNA